MSPDGKPQAGMGVSAGDYDLDGNLDILKTNFAGDTPSLYRDRGDLLRELTLQRKIFEDVNGACTISGKVNDVNMANAPEIPLLGEKTQEFQTKIASEYGKMTGLSPKIVVTGAAGGDPNCRCEAGLRLGRCNIESP